MTQPKPRINWEVWPAWIALGFAVFGMYGAFSLLPYQIGELKADVVKLEERIDLGNAERKELQLTLGRIDEHLKNIDEGIRDLKRVRP